MLRVTLWLTVATFAGMLAGLGREWLLVADWGAGRHSDAFLVALFLPEAARTMLAGGILSAAALPLWQETALAYRAGWLAGQIRHWVLFGFCLSGLVVVLAPWLVDLVGPGLLAVDRSMAVQVLWWLALVLPGLVLQAVLSVPMQAIGRYVLPGLGSLLYNLPPVFYLWWSGKHADSVVLAQMFVLGSIIMSVVLLPANWKLGWRPWLPGHAGANLQIWQRVWPLLASSGASQGLALLERLVASLLGEGMVTVVNLARKLANIPLLGLMGLNQVLLGKMSAEALHHRRRSLEQGLFASTVLTLPAAAWLIGAAPALVVLLLPSGLRHTPLALLLGLFSVSIVFGSWNALLARYYYAAGDTHTPLRCELQGSVMQAIVLLVSFRVIGVAGIAGAVMCGVLTTAILLILRLDRRLLADLGRLSGLAVLLCAVSAYWLFGWTGHGPWWQVVAASLYAGGLLAGFVVVYRRQLVGAQKTG